MFKNTKIRAKHGMSFLLISILLCCQNIKDCGCKKKTEEDEGSRLDKREPYYADADRANK